MKGTCSRRIGKCKILRTVWNSYWRPPWIHWAKSLTYLLQWINTNTSVTLMSKHLDIQETGNFFPEVNITWSNFLEFLQVKFATSPNQFWKFIIYFCMITQYLDFPKSCIYLSTPCSHKVWPIDWTFCTLLQTHWQVFMNCSRNWINPYPWGISTIRIISAIHCNAWKRHVRNAENFPFDALNKKKVSVCFPKSQKNIYFQTRIEAREVYRWWNWHGVIVKVSCSFDIRVKRVCHIVIIEW